MKFTRNSANDAPAAIVLILGSGPNVTDCQVWPRAPFDRIVAINNAWRVRPDWDHCIYPEDFPEDRHPPEGPGHVRAEAFVPAQNAYGGFVYAGGTMAFTAGYWALHALAPRVIACFGCDMVYEGARTHFYGRGTADPLRPDVTLRSLEAKSARLMLLAARQGCAVVNLSTSGSRLALPRARSDGLGDLRPLPAEGEAVEALLERERRLGYHVPSGRYWEEAERFDPEEIDALDAGWLAAARLDLEPAPA
ncbi:hypothetical protein [Histidinibacterium aquaticum]|uniref:Uncharacterized protein n=1 Tax=Histidinibacterium aquaticum TaxID=2613962 RepID=A0A5J5GQW0_9RHOB|nr:hypothetical protein [Histidinibacterium aquaticum]KAA9010580.1 hypothetical protein F3S47_04900 [Histidinibacterium aquaticum]